MGQSTKLRILNSIGRVYERSTDCKLESSFFATIDKDLTFLAGYFRTTKSQAFFIAIVFALNYKGESVDLKDLVNHFDCNPMKILVYSDDINYLLSAGIFSRQKVRHRRNLPGLQDQFFINATISEAVLLNQPIPETTQGKTNDIFELLEKLYQLGEQRDNDEISTRELFSQSKELLSSNLHLPLIRRIDIMKLGIEDAYFYLYMIWRTVSGEESTEIGSTLKGIYDIATKRVHYMQRLISGENPLIKKNSIEIVEARFLNDTEVKLTEDSRNLLQECGIHFLTNKTKKKNIISPEDIPYRKLHFGEAEMEQLFLLKDVLSDKRFKQTQQRLTAKNLPMGITALLHGAPGTGKTEIVKQLAKKTKREIMKVDISQSKSMWFGESERIIKRIFDDYKSFAELCDRTPILLFNEADAIISKRKDVLNSGVAQTENAMQNILLEELENFKGILVATTNFAANLDPAFERRFLFKIRFQKPDTSIKAKIWKSKLPNLSQRECHLLAQKYDFSGGQIDNVVRKSEIHETVHGEKVTLEKLLSFCTEETIECTRAKIGFSNS